jgi:hypothetical protein
MSLAFGLYARLSTLVFLPLLGLCFALRYGAGAAWGWVWLLAISYGVLAQGVFTVAVGRLLFSEQLRVGQVLRLFGRRFFSYVGMLTASRTLLFATSMTLGFALPYAWPRLLFVHEASLLEGAGAIDAIQRSNRFVLGRTWPVLGALIALLVTQAGIVLVAELLGQGLVKEVLQLGTPFGSLFRDHGSPYALLGYLLSIPYVSTARFLHYIDARTRADGWDVQLRFMAVAAREGVPA